MRLSEEDVQLFYKLYSELLVYVNLNQKTLKQASTPDELMVQPVDERIQVRDQLYENMELLDSFLKENPPHFSDEELEIVRSWKHFIRDRFFLFRHLKKYSIFLDASSSPKPYGVLSISDSLEDFFPCVPVMVETVLLPFKGQIIYDGYIRPFNIIFGGGICNSLKNSYNEAKATYGIVTSLPFEPKAKQQSDEDRLKFYLKNEGNRDYYWEEIQDLIIGNHPLTVVYHQEMGKSYARSFGRRLREMGLSDVWFGILEGLMVASGKKKADLEKNLKAVVPPSMREFVYLYHLKKKTGKK